MTVAFTVGNASHPVAAAILTVAITLSGSNRGLFVAVREPSGAGPPTSNVTSVTYNGVALTRIMDRVGAGAKHISVFASVGFEPATGTNDLVVNFSATTSNEVFWTGCSSVDQTTCYSATAFDGADSGTSSSSNISVNTGGMAIDFMAMTGGTGLTKVGAQTSTDPAAQETGYADNSSYLANATSMGWTWTTSANYVHAVVAVNPVGTAPAFVPDSPKVINQAALNRASTF